MSTNPQTPVLQNTPFLRVQRSFPTQDAQALSIEVDRAYCDTAAKVNSRTIGVYAPNKPTAIGDQWILSGASSKQQTLRQVYPYTAAGSTTINHNINFNSVSMISRIYGTVVDTSGNWYPLPLVNAAAATNQIAILVNATQIVITAGGGAPTIASGVVVLEWVSNV